MRWQEAGDKQDVRIEEHRAATAAVAMTVAPPLRHDVEGNVDRAHLPGGELAAAVGRKGRRLVDIAGQPPSTRVELRHELILKGQRQAHVWLALARELPIAAAGRTHPRRPPCADFCYPRGRRPYGSGQRQGHSAAACGSAAGRQARGSR
jgi:hypothetical protein